MNNKKRTIKKVVAGLGLCVAMASPFALAGCSSNGQSAYDIAKANGFEGTKEEWLESLKPKISISEDGYWVINGEKSTTKAVGENGTNGTNGQKGEQGQQGADGRGIVSIQKIRSQGNVDTYQITYTSGNPTTFTITNGANGQQGKGIASITKISTTNNLDTYKISYTDGTSTDFTVANGTNGTNGKSAYELAVEKGYEGDLESWLLTLVGAKGEQGDSAYDIAKANGFEGTEEEWLLTLKGEQGVGVATINCEYGYDNNGVYSMIFTFTMTDGSVQTVYVAVPKKVSSIYLTGDNSFYALDENTEITGLKLAVYYDDGSYEEVDVTKSMISGIDDFSVPGIYNDITINYQGRSISQQLQILPNLENLTKIGDFKTEGTLSSMTNNAVITVYKENYCKFNVEGEETVMQWQYLSEELSETNKVANVLVGSEVNGTLIITIDATTPTEEFMGTCNSYAPSASNLVKTYNGAVNMGSETPAVIKIYEENNISMAELCVVTGETEADVMPMFITLYNGGSVVNIMGTNYKLIADGTFIENDVESLTEGFYINDLETIGNSTQVAVKELSNNVYNKISKEANSVYNLDQLNEKLGLSLNPYVEIGSFKNMFTINLTIGDVMLYQDQTFNLSIGNGVYLKDKVMQVKDGKIYVFATVLAVEATNADTINVNGFVENFDLFRTDSTLPLTNVSFADDDLDLIEKLSENEYHITLKTTNKMLAFYYENALAEDVILTKKEYSYNYSNEELFYGFTNTDEINSQYAYAIYPIGWVTDVTQINPSTSGSTLTVKAYVLGKGVFNVIIDITLNLE